MSITSKRSRLEVIQSILKRAWENGLPGRQEMVDEIVTKVRVETAADRDGLLKFLIENEPGGQPEKHVPRSLRALNMIEARENGADARVWRDTLQLPEGAVFFPNPSKVLN